MSEPAQPPGDPRIGLAAFRTQLAIDRTALAWVRTTLTMASFGFGTVAFFRSIRQANPSEATARLHQGAIAFGVCLIVLGVVATVIAAAGQWLALRRLRRGEAPRASAWPLSITVSLLVSVLFLIGLWAVLT